MSLRKPKFVDGEIYHVYNRGVEKRKIFVEKLDYFRMVHDLYELNDRNAVINPTYRTKRPSRTEKPRENLVELLSFVLMPNHYHFALRQLQENGVVKFMQKLGVGYAMYFNKKYERVGSLFQGRFKARHVDTHDYLCNLLGYIHTNPADLIQNYGDRVSIILDNLEKYRWSSFPDYTGIKNFPSVTSRDFALEVMGGEKEVRENAARWIAYRNAKAEVVEKIKFMETGSP
jgi:putative transposase